MVLVDRIVASIDTHKVMADNFKGAYEATAHLVQNGYSAIAHLANSEYLSITRERVAGYRQALTDAGMEFSETRGEDGGLGSAGIGDGDFYFAFVVVGGGHLIDFSKCSGVER